MIPVPAADEGWTWLVNATKWHYFVENRSLCGRWALIGPQEYHRDNDNSPDNCAMCKQRKAQRDKKREG